MLKKSLKTILVVLLLLATSLVFTACTKKTEYKVTVKDGDTVVDTLDSLPSTDLSKYIKDGYVLEGIYLDAEFNEKFDAKTYGELQADITLYLKYAQKKYYITFNTNGGVALDPYEVTYGSAYTLPTPEKEGYNFIGYTLDGEDFDIEGTYNKTNSVKLFANWEIAKYSVKFLNASNDAQVGTTLTVEHGSKVNAPQVSLGYQIENGKVYTDKACTQEFDLNSQIKGNTDLYVKVIPISYTITINANGGEAVAPQTIAFNSNYTLPTPEKEGYDFAGYTIDGVAFPQTGTYTKNSNVTVTANWAIKTFEVKFINVGTTPNEQLGNTLTVNYNGKVTMIAYSVAGYELLNGKAYKDAGLTTEFNFATETIKANTEIYVKVIAKTFNITVNQATGVNTTAVYGGTYTITTPEREGFDFVKFTYNGVDFAATGTYNYTTDIAITAVWEAIEGYYNRDVYFYDGASEYEIYRRDVVIGDIVRIDSLPNPVKAGYEFNGWYLDSELQNKATANITIADDLSLYAKFTANVYTITIEVNGGVAIDPISATYGAIYNLPTPEKEGYDFTGFTYQGAPFVKGDVYSYANDITLVATWEIKTFDVKFINVDGNVQIGDTLTIEYNQKVSGLPTISTVGSEILNGKAYTNEELTTEFDFNTQIQANTTLYIKIIKSVYTITVDTDGGSTVENVNITYNEIYTLATPTKNGFKFVRYIVDGTETTFATSGTYEFTNGIKVIAVWEELIVEVGENDISDDYNLFAVDNKYFKEKKVYNSNETEYKYVFLKGSTVSFANMTISSKDAGALATIENGNTVKVGNTLGTFTITITKTVDNTLVTYTRTAEVVENVAFFDVGAQYLGRDAASFKTNTVVETLSVGISNFIPEVRVKNIKDVDLNFEQSNMSVVITNAEGAEIDDGFEYNAGHTGFNFDSSLVGGVYTLSFRPKYVLEDKVVAFTVEFNNGVNVYTNSELKLAFRDLAVQEINVHRNIVAELDDNQYVDGIKNKGPYAEEELVLNPDGTVNYEQSKTGNVYNRHLLYANNDDLKLHGNSFKLDASKLPRVDAIQNDTWVTFGDATPAVGRVANHHAMIFSYQSATLNGTTLYARGGNNKFTIDNLAIYGNNVGDSGELETYNSGNNSYYTMSASYNAIRHRGGYVTCDNVAIRNTLIGVFISGLPEAKEGSTTGKYEQYAATTTLNNVYIDNSWANSICAFDTTYVELNNSYIGHSGGAAIHFDIYVNHDANGDPVDLLSALSVDASTKIENWVLGTESWFVAYNMGGAGTLIKTLAANCVENHEKGEVFNFAIFYQQKGDEKDWAGNERLFDLTLGGGFNYYTSMQGAKIYVNGAQGYVNFTYNLYGVNIGAVLPGRIG